MENQKRMSDSKYKHSIYIYIVFNSIYHFSGKGLYSDTNKIQQTPCIQFD